MNDFQTKEMQMLENQIKFTVYGHPDDLKKVLSFILAHDARLIDMVIGMIEVKRKTVRCASCDGAKCAHTICCLTLKSLTEELTKKA